MSACAHSSQLFTHGKRNLLRGCVSAIDGIAVDPAAVCARCNKHNILRQQHRRFAFNMQAAVGAHFEAQFLSVVAAGSFHDSTALAACGLPTQLASDNGLPAVF